MHSTTRSDAVLLPRSLSIDGVVVPYAVVADCTRPPSDADFYNLDLTTTHEAVEATTDPIIDGVGAGLRHVDDAHYAWQVSVGGFSEVADLCDTLPTATSLPGTLFSAQRIWSNAAMLAGHDPCVPAPTPDPYFNAMPVLPDDVDIVLGPTTVRTRGVRVPIGQSRVVEIDLYSDGDTGGPWSIVPGLQTIDDDGAGGPCRLLYIQASARGVAVEGRWLCERDAPGAQAQDRDDREKGLFHCGLRLPFTSVRNLPQPRGVVRPVTRPLCSPAQQMTMDSRPVEHAPCDGQGIVALVDAGHKTRLADNLGEYLGRAERAASDVDRAATLGEARLPAGESDLFGLSLGVRQQSRHLLVVGVQDVFTRGHHLPQTAIEG